MIEHEIPRPVKTHHHIGQAISVRGITNRVKRVDGINAKKSRNRELTWTRWKK